MSLQNTHQNLCPIIRKKISGTRSPYQRRHHEDPSLFVLCIVFIALLAIPATVSADSYVGGIPLTTVQTGTVTGDLYIDATPAPNWGDKVVTKTFTLPANAVGNITWARLYVSAYAGHMQNDYAFTMTNKLDGNGDGTYENVWPETGHAAFQYMDDGYSGLLGNDNSAFSGHGTNESYKMINDHETRVTSDYLAYYDVTNLISNRTVFTNVVTTGSYDGRIKVITLVVAYNDSSSTTQTTYFVNQGHDVCSYYTEDNQGTPAVGTTTFGTTGLSGITSATLIADYMASNNGNYGFPTSANTFTYTGGTPPVEGDFTNLPLDNVADVQGAYSGVDSWDVTTSVTGSSDTTFAYSRYFPGTGTSAFYKIPLAFLVVKKPAPAVAPVAGFAADTVSGTAPLNITFTDQSSNTPTSWAWAFGDSGTSTEQNPVHQYTAAGNYTVTLTATNAGGSDTETKTNYITISAPIVAPVTAFSGTPISGTAPLTVTFTDASTNVPTSWVWGFGDSNTTNTTVQNPVHTYTMAGTYTVNLTATNAGGSNTTTRSGYITVTTGILPDLTITGTVNPVPASAVFARESNPVKITNVKNNGTVAVTNVVVALYASDVSSTVPVATATIASLASGATNTTTLTDPTIRNLEGSSITYTAKVDPDNLIAETFEANNAKTSTSKPVKYNGYKGKGIYWDGGSNITTRKTFDLHGNVVYYTQSDSYYKAVDWTDRTEIWTAANLPVPSTATVEKVYLYIAYNWDQTAAGVPDMNAVFNGNTLTLGTPYMDESNFGAYADYEYGLYPAIDITSQFNNGGDNTLVMTPNTGNKQALYPSTLVVIYSDPSETRKQIFINEECDEIGYSASSYGTTLEEATAYAPFSGMTIDTATVRNATLHSFAGSAGPDEGNFLFNGATVATNAWQGTLSTGSAQSFDVKSYLTATGNEAGIQGTTSGGMDALQQILVVEYAATTTAPVAAFSSTPTSGTAPLTVTFTDASTNAPTSWSWDFGDSDTTNATEQNPVHTYATTGTYTVTLTATNSAGSDSEVMTGYITVSTGVVALPDIANPPTDPDNDGIYEDLNGNGRKDYNDLQLFFSNLVWIANNEPVAPFDFNGNGRIDFNDLQVLYGEMV
jgi:PKD repeat protein